MDHQHYCYLHGEFWSHGDIDCHCHGSAMICPVCRKPTSRSGNGGQNANYRLVESAPSAPPSLAGRSSGILVLLVTRDTKGETFRSQLSSAGYTILAVEDCGDACRVLEQQPGVQVILTDLLLSDGSWEVILQAVARKQLPARIIVILRGAVDKSYVDQHLDILESGAYDVLAEPDCPEALESIVAAAALRVRHVRH